ncbi:MAG: hypothetical protein AAF363_15725 [Bacteroidota bacterium]
MKRFRTKKQTITVANGGSVDLSGNSVSLGKNFNTIEGVAVITKSLGGVGDYDIGFEYGTDQFMQPISSKMLEPNQAVPPNERYTKVNLKGNDGTDFKIVGTLDAVPNSEFKIQVIVLVSEDIIQA